MACCNCESNDDEPKPGVTYYGCETFGVLGPWWVCEHCWFSARAVEDICRELPKFMAHLTRRAEVERLKGELVASALRHSNADRRGDHVERAKHADVFDRALGRLAAMAMEATHG